MKITKKIKYLLDDFMFLRTYKSPFKPLKLKWYFGKTSVPVPYFLPRKWVPYTMQDAIEAATKDMNNPKLIKKSFEERVESYKHYSKAIPLRVGFSSCSLGWKTKWTSNDFRHEWNPRWSFVFFGYQICLTFYSPYDSRYWECWLYYHLATDKTKSAEERIQQCKKEFPCIWTSHSKEGKITTDYWTVVLKDKYV